MIQTLDTVLGASVTVRVAVKDTAEVIFKYSERVPSAVASGIVNVSSAFAAICLVPRLKASAIRDRLVLVEVPHVPDSSPVAISFSRKSLTYVAMFYPHAAVSTGIQVAF